MQRSCRAPLGWDATDAAGTRSGVAVEAEPEAEEVPGRVGIVLVRGPTVQDHRVREPLHVAGSELHVEMEARRRRDLVDEIQQLELARAEPRYIRVPLRLFDVEADVHREETT